MHAELDQKALKRPDMEWTEAKATCDFIRRGMDEVRVLVLDLHDRNGWAVLGYKTWRECVVTEFAQSQASLYRHLEAARIEAEISQIENGPVPESQLLALSPVEPGKRAEVWQDAKATAPEGVMTAKHVRRTVSKTSPAPKPRSEPPAPTPRSQYKTEVNGQVSADPPDIAKARAAGRIGADVVVEVTEPEPLVESEPEVETPSTQEASDEEWLGELPLSAKLGASRIRGFQADALDYRRTEDARKKFQHAVSRALKGNGVWAFRVRRLLKTDHPKHWLICPTVENGGCGGSGEVSLIGQCPKCHGRGYYVR